MKILSDVKIIEVRRKHGHFYASERARDGVMPGTINRGLAVLKNMMTFALEKELIEAHPLLKFRLIPEVECALQVLTLEEKRRLVVSMPTLVSQAYIAILGETGLRMTEGFTLRWELVNLTDRLLTVEKTKGGKARSIPLSDYAIEWLSIVPRCDSPYVFLIARQPAPATTTSAIHWNKEGKWQGCRGSASMTCGISGQPNGSKRAWTCARFRFSWGTSPLRPRCGTRTSHHQTRPIPLSRPSGARPPSGSGRQAGNSRAYPHQVMIGRFW